MYRRVAGSNVPPPTSVKSTFIDSGLRREKSFFPFNVCRNVARFRAVLLSESRGSIIINAF